LIITPAIEVKEGEDDDKERPESRACTFSLPTASALMNWRKGPCGSFLFQPRGGPPSIVRKWVERSRKVRLLNEIITPWAISVVAYIPPMIYSS
jgi:hypothetical protein